MEIIINGVIVNVSDENQELLNELVDRIINENVSGVTGNEDFDIANTDTDYVATLNIDHEFFNEDEPSDISKERQERQERTYDKFSDDDMKAAFD